MRTNLGTKNGNPDTDVARRLSRVEQGLQQIPSRFPGANVLSTSDRFENSTNYSLSVVGYQALAGWAADSPIVIPNTIAPPANVTTDGTTFTCRSAGYYRLSCQLSSTLTIQLTSGGGTISASGPVVVRLTVSYPAQVAVPPVSACTPAFFGYNSVPTGTSFAGISPGLFVSDEVYLKVGDTFTVQRQFDVSNLVLAGGSLVIGTTDSNNSILLVTKV